RLRIAAGLGDAETHMRARGRSGVADQRDPFEHDTGRREVVNRGEEWQRDVAQTIDEGGRHDAFGLGAHLRDQAFADERRRHRVFVLMAVASMHMSLSVWASPTRYQMKL